MRKVAEQCRASRELISLELDGELSELESVRLAAHLDGCATCRALQAELGGLTSVLRTAPLEPLSRPIALPQRVRVFLRPLQVGAAAAAIAVVAGLAGVLGTLRANAPAQRVPAVETGEGLDALRAVRRPQLVRAGHHAAPRVVQIGRAGGRPAV
jgi:anti-sigma factor RsiW